MTQVERDTTLTDRLMEGLVYEQLSEKPLAFGILNSRVQTQYQERYGRPFTGTADGFVWQVVKGMYSRNVIRYTNTKVLCDSTKLQLCLGERPRKIPIRL